jgi:acyl-CoA thioester hydrolase
MLTEHTTSTLYATVEHVDVDSYGIVHFSRYVSLVESAALMHLHRIGLSPASFSQQDIELRVREFRMNYKSAAGFGDVLKLSCRIARVAIGSLTYEVDIHKISAEDGGGEPQHIAMGTLNLVFISSSSKQPIALPRFLVEKLDEDEKSV